MSEMDELTRQLAEVMAERDAALAALREAREALRLMFPDADPAEWRLLRTIDAALAQQPATSPGPTLVEQYSSGRRPCGCDTTCIGGSNIDSDRVCRAAKVNSGPGAPTIAEVADEIRALVPGGWQVSRAEEEERAEAERAVIEAAREYIGALHAFVARIGGRYERVENVESGFDRLEKACDRLAALDAKEVGRG